MNVKQKNIRSFEFIFDNRDEITGFDSFFVYVESNLEILKNYLIILKGDVSPKVIAYLEELNLIYFHWQDATIELNSKPLVVEKKVVEPIVKIEKEEPKDEEIENSNIINKSLVVNRNVRSGEEIVSDYDITIFGRINSGSLVRSKSNVTVYGIIDGTVISNGEFLITYGIKNGTVILRDKEIEKNSSEKLVKYTLKDKELCIEELF